MASPWGAEDKCLQYGHEIQPWEGSHRLDNEGTYVPWEGLYLEGKMWSLKTLSRQVTLSICIP